MVLRTFNFWGFCGPLGGGAVAHWGGGVVARLGISYTTSEFAPQIDHNMRNIQFLLHKNIEGIKNRSFWRFYFQEMCIYRKSIENESYRMMPGLQGHPSYQVFLFNSSFWDIA